MRERERERERELICTPPKPEQGGTDALEMLKKNETDKKHKNQAQIRKFEFRRGTDHDLYPS